MFFQYLLHILFVLVAIIFCRNLLLACDLCQTHLHFTHEDRVGQKLNFMKVFVLQ